MIREPRRRDIIAVNSKGQSWGGAGFGWRGVIELIGRIGGRRGGRGGTKGFRSERGDKWGGSRGSYLRCPH